MDKFFVRHTVEMQLHIPTCYANDIGAGITKLLSSLLLRYVSQFEGIPISFDNITLYDENAKILYDNPLFHLQITVDFIVFKPIIGKNIKGYINKVSSEHIGILILNIINATVYTDDLKKDHIWSPQTQTWVNDATGESLSIGSQYELTIKSFKPMYDGSILIIGTPGNWVAKNL